MPGFIKRFGRKLFSIGRAITLAGLVVGTIIGLVIAADRALMTNTRPSPPPGDSA
jgi:hypothetical protein